MKVKEFIDILKNYDLDYEIEIGFWRYYINDDEHFPEYIKINNLKFNDISYSEKIISFHGEADEQ